MAHNEPQKIMFVDDDQDLLSMLKNDFEGEALEVSTFFDALPALRHVSKYGLPHLAVIDLNLPSMHGFEFAEKLKALGDVPIVFLTANTETNMVVDGLTRYADDYVTKPFKVRELIARVQRILSRIPDFAYTQAPMLEIDEHLSVDFGNSRLLIDRHPVMLTPTEANLLHILVRNAGRVVTSSTLIARVWPVDEVYEDTLRVHMHRLRRKLEPDYRHPKYIQTERGIGYRFRALEVERPDSADAQPVHHSARD